MLFIDLNNRNRVPVICRNRSNIEISQKLKGKNVDVGLILPAHYYKPEETLWKRYKNIIIPITIDLDFGVYIIKAITV